MGEKNCKYFTKNLLLHLKSLYFVSIINLKILLWKNRMLQMKTQLLRPHNQK